eukprot:917069_1
MAALARPAWRCMSINASNGQLCSAAHFCIATQHNGMNNNNGHRLIKDLYSQHRKKNYNRHFNDKIVRKAFEIYKRIDEHRNANVINASLKILALFKNCKSLTTQR